MNLEFRDGLLFSSITIHHDEKSITIPHVVIDTGAAESIVSIDAVQGMFNSYEPGDQLRFMTGIGGREASVRRKIHKIQFHSFQMINFSVDFGRIGDDTQINGLIGLDILIPGQFILDLGKLQLNAAAHND